MIPLLQGFLTVLLVSCGVNRPLDLAIRSRDTRSFCVEQTTW